MGTEPEKIIPGTEMFGMVKFNEEQGWRPLLQRQATGADACTKCNGFGSYGMPLCGFVEMCNECKASGLRQPGQPPYVEPTPEKEVCEPARSNMGLGLGLGVAAVAILVLGFLAIGKIWASF